MIKIEKTLYTLIKAILVVGGPLLTVLGWVFTFTEVSPAIKNLPWTSIGILLFVLGMIWVVIDLYRRYVWWAEPEIRLSSIIKTEVLPYRLAEVFCLTVENKEETEITDCYATLKAINLYGGEMIPIPIVENNRLKWMETNLSNQSCEITIPPKSDSILLRVADTINGFSFSVCQTQFLRHDLMGVNLIDIRLDGKMNGRNIKPQFFSGYIYISNSIASGELVTHRIFEEGDWARDSRIPKYS